MYDALPNQSQDLGLPELSRLPIGEQIDAADDPGRGLEWLIAAGLAPTQLVAIHPETGKADGTWLDAATARSVAGWVRKLNRDHDRGRFNIYFTANLPRRGCGRKASKNDIEAIRCVFADIDAKAGRDMAAAFAAIGRVPPPPTFIIMTGGGFQPMWMLDEPLATTPENVRRAEALGKRIAEVTGGDAVQNIDRILRLPFTINWPNQKKRDNGRVPCPSGLVIAGMIQP